MHQKIHTDCLSLLPLTPLLVISPQAIPVDGELGGDLAVDVLQLGDGPVHLLQLLLRRRPHVTLDKTKLNCSKLNISNHLNIVRHLGPGLAAPRLVCPDDQQRHHEAERHAEGGVGEDDERVLLQTLGLPAGLAAPLQLRGHGDDSCCVW